MSRSLQTPVLAIFSVGVCLAAALLGSRGRAAFDAPKMDPVQELNQALRSALQDLMDQDRRLAQKLERMEPDAQRAALNEERRATLMRRVEALQTAADMSRALTLASWRIDPQRDEMATIDGSVRKLLAERLTKEVRRVLKEGELSSRMACLTLIGDLGPLRLDFSDQTGIGRLLEKDLADLVKNGDRSQIRARAARALGRIFADPAVALPALRSLLESGSESERAAAADALETMVRVAVRPGTGPNEAMLVIGPRRDVMGILAPTVAALTKGFKDTNPEVRRRSAEALRQAIVSLELFIPGERPEMDGRAGGREMDTQRIVAQAYQEQQPVLSVIRDQIPHLTELLQEAKESDVKARLAGNQALEAAADLRLSWLRRLGKPAPGKAADDPLRAALQATVPLLAKELSHQEVRVKLAALYVLESLGAEAGPAGPDLVKTLQDNDSFVRWGAIRALGKMAPLHAEAVPELAKLLRDKNGDVRVTAAAALERYGPAAKAAVGELAAALKHKDPQTRRWVLTALTALGTEASPAVPELIAALRAPEEETRSEAAGLLGKLGAAARPAREALQKALDDPSASVREAASGALLTIK
jgi:HEAT repeat protein